MDVVILNHDLMIPDDMSRYDTRQSSTSQERILRCSQDFFITGRGSRVVTVAKSLPTLHCRIVGLSPSATEDSPY
ncbi:hypothetical protein TNCV_4858241 [Trichonephila clavipes]|nr:hypothetical protein TNCV_4858241 [Trichonephila clavipes]